MNGRMGDLKIFVERLHKCQATHIESVIVRERSEGMSVWDGVVETFQLSGHPEAKRAYAWEIPASQGKESEYKVVLGLPPVNSAQDALRTAMLPHFKKLVDMAKQVLEGEQ